MENKFELAGFGTDCTQMSGVNSFKLPNVILSLLNSNFIDIYFFVFWKYLIFNVEFTSTLNLLVCTNFT